jgi:hypothetical protein
LAAAAGGGLASLPKSGCRVQLAGEFGLNPATRHRYHRVGPELKWGRRMTKSAYRPIDYVLANIEIRGPVAVWVLGAHFYAIVVPIVLCVVTSHHWEFLSQATHKPFLFYVAAVILAAGSVFEVAQNTIDKWYLTPATASANGVGLCDLLFYWFVTAGQGVMAIAIAGDAWWVNAIVLAAVLIFPVCYLTQTAQFAPMGIVGLLVAVTGYQAFGDPIIYLSVFLAGVTMYFFSLLLKTGAQSLHGLTTATASSGLWFFVWALHSAAAGTPNSWWVAVAILIVTIVVLGTLWPVLTRLSPSPRVARPAS